MIAKSDEHGSGHHPRTSSSIQPLLIAVVDDKDMIRSMLARSLRDLPGVEIAGEAEDGLQAIDLVRRTQPHAVVMDIEMPRMNGIEATKAIKAEFPGIVVVAFSADGSLREAVLAAGASDFFPKGERVTALIERLRSLATDRGPGELASLSPTVREIMSQIGSPAAVTERRPGGLPTITHVNDAFVEFTGYESTDVVGTSADFWLAFGVGLDEWTEIGTKLRAGDRVDKEIKARHRNGSRVNVRLTMLPFVSEESLEVITVLTPAGSGSNNEHGRQRWNHQDLANAVWEALYQGAPSDDVREVVDQELSQARNYLDDLDDDV